MPADAVPLRLFAKCNAKTVHRKIKYGRVYDGACSRLPLPRLSLITNFFLAGGAGDTAGGSGGGGGTAGALGKALRSEGVLSGKGLRAVLSGRGVRAEPSGSGLRTFGGGVGAAGTVADTDAGTTAVIVPLERVDEGLGVIDDLGPGEGLEEGDELLVEDDFAR